MKDMATGTWENPITPNDIKTYANNVTVRRWGKVRTLNLGGVYDNPICTLDQEDSPVADVTIFGKVYNGSNR